MFDLIHIALWLNFKLIMVITIKKPNGISKDHQRRQTARVLWCIERHTLHLADPKPKSKASWKLDHIAGYPLFHQTIQSCHLGILIEVLRSMKWKFKTEEERNFEFYLLFWWQNSFLSPRTTQTEQHLLSHSVASAFL